MGRDKKLSSLRVLRKRAMAFSLDLFLIGLIEKALTLTFIKYLDFTLAPLPPASLSKLGQASLKLHYPVFGLVFMTYFFLFYFLNRGATPGKTLLKIQVQSPKDRPFLTLRECLLRTFCYFISYSLAFVPFLLNLFSHDKKGLADWISHTQSVYLPNQTLQNLDHHDLKESAPVEQLPLFDHEDISA